MSSSSSIGGYARRPTNQFNSLAETMTAEDAAAETLERQRASDKALAALRSEGLARSLVVHCTGLRTNSTNFDTADRVICVVCCQHDHDVFVPTPVRTGRKFDGRGCLDSR